MVNLAADASGTTQVDAVQQTLGVVASHAVPVPEPTITAIRIGRTRVEVDLAWQLDLAGEALSDLRADDGMPLASVRGAAVFVINGPSATPRPWDWSWAADLGADAVNGFSTDARATISLNRADWPNQTVSFALALTYDGDGDASGEGPSSRSPIGTWLGRPTRWIALPPAGTIRPVALVDASAHFAGPTTLHVAFTGQAEPIEASYRVWAQLANGRRVLLTTVDGGLGSYDLDLEVEWRRRLKQWSVEIEMVDRLARVVDQVTVPVTAD